MKHTIDTSAGVEAISTGEVQYTQLNEKRNKMGTISGIIGDNPEVIVSGWWFV